MTLLRTSFTLLAVATLAVSSGAFAQDAGLPGGFKHDSNQPIKISADALEVRQNEQVAIFTGSVDARQGTVRMQAQTLTVTYDPEAEDDTQAGAIKRVRAEGDVFISSDENTASGNWADYDVATGAIIMGDTVTLTQGPNVIGGNSLSINLNTGQALMKGAAATLDQSGNSSGSGRVEMILNPSSASQN